MRIGIFRVLQSLFFIRHHTYSPAFAAKSITNARAQGLQTWYVADHYCILPLTAVQQSVGAIAAIVGAQYWWFNRKKNVFGGAWIRVRLILPILLVAITAAWAEGQMYEQSGDETKAAHMARHSNMFSRLLRANIISPKFPLLWPRLIAIFSIVSLVLQLIWPNFSRRTNIVKVGLNFPHK